jgi:hypothetical protein
MKANYFFGRFTAGIFLALLGSFFLFSSGVVAGWLLGALVAAIVTCFGMGAWLGNCFAGDTFVLGWSSFFLIGCVKISLIGFSLANCWAKQLPQMKINNMVRIDFMFFILCLPAP